ncbi:MAG TPA: PAS domain S-box protein [Thermoanaerobaculia bacterium]
MDAENQFRTLVEQASDFAIVLLDPDGRIVLWNLGAENVFGWKSDEVIGQHFRLIAIADDCELGIPERELSIAAKDGRAEDTRWHLRKDGRKIFVDGITEPVIENGRLTGFSKFCRDVTERYVTQERLAAQLVLTNLLRDEVRPFAEVARDVMETVCDKLGWDVGGLWECRGNHIHCVDNWRRENVDPDAAAALCEGQMLERGVGLVGRVWDKGEALWVPDFSDTRQYPRAGLAAAARMRSAFAFPIGVGEQTVGVMEFFSIEQREPQQALLPIMTVIGAQIGDYMERRRTHQALRESEQRHRVITEAAQDAIFTIDERSTILFCNQAVERVFGWKPEELVGQSLSAIMPERFRAGHQRGIERFLQTRQRHIPWTGVELPAMHREGHEFPCEISFGAWTSEGHTIFTGFARDVTERKRAQEQLQASLEEAEAARAQLERRAEEESAFRHLASALTGAVEMTDVLHEITNRATHVTRADGVYVERVVLLGGTKMVEVVASAGRGAPPRGLRVPFPGSMTDEIVRGREPVILADMNHFGRAMAPYLVDTCGECEVLVTPLSAENEILGALVLLNSASSGRRFRDADAIRARTLGDLSSLALRRVRLMEEEREAKEKAEAAVRVRDETLGIVSHDLRNPLTKIALSADLLADAPAEDQRDLVQTIRTAARQMERLIQDLLDVARVEAGRLSVEREYIDPEPLVRDACASHAPLAEQKGQRIVCRMDQPLPQICADRDRLVQVFGNLIGNALKFTPERGTITIEATPVDRGVQFAVLDTGNGIPEADLRQVFRPYWQAKKTAHMGAGLGLAIVRGIVEAHGGKVWAENAPGGGALFRFTIPVD